MNTIFNFMTKENITFLLALFGSLGTLITWISSFVKNSKNINLKITRYSYEDNIIQFEFLLENKSRLPISITSLDLKIDKHYYHTPIVPMVIQTVTVATSGITTSKQDISTIQLPINLSSLSAVSGYLCFVLSQSDVLDASKPLTFQVCSNRGTAIEMKLELPLVACEYF